MCYNLESDFIKKKVQRINAFHTWSHHPIMEFLKLFIFFLECFVHFFCFYRIFQQIRQQEANFGPLSLPNVVVLILDLYPHITLSRILFNEVSIGILYQ